MKAAADRMQALVITGMHRSGTSLVARMLRHTGVNIGSDLVEADDGNPHGYYEDREFVAFHDDLLRRSEQRIFVQEESYIKTLSEEDVSRAEGLVGQRSGNGLWGWKDPRTALFLDFWSQLLPNARFVFMLRHPIDVVASLMRRNSDAEIEVRVDPLAGLRSWEIYNDAISSFLERQPERSLLCNIYRIVEDPGALIHAARKKLGLPIESKTLADLICREDLHATYASPGVDAILRRGAPRVARLYRKLESMADLPGAGHRPSEDEDPELARRLEVIASLLSGRVTDRVMARPLMAAALGLLDPDAASLSGHDVRSRLSRTEGQVHRLRAHSDNLERLRAVDAGLLRKLRRHGENLEQIVAERSAALRALESQVAALEPSYRETSERARELSGRCEDLERRLADREATLGGLRTHAENLEGELGRRRSVVKDLEAHVEDLEAERERDREQLLELSRHGENLAGELGQRQIAIEDLKTHVKNLEAYRERDQSQILELSKHAENLERVLDERQSLVEELAAHAGNLEAALARDQEHIEELRRHADNLGALRAALDGRLERRDAEIARLRALVASRPPKVE